MTAIVAETKGSAFHNCNFILDTWLLIFLSGKWGMLHLDDLVFNVAATKLRTSENSLLLSIDFLAIIDYNGSMKNNSPYRHI